MIQFKELVLGTTYDELMMIRKWRSSVDVNKFMYTDSKPTPEEQVRWFESTLKDDSCKYMIISYKNIDVGMVYLTDIDYISKHCNWGIYIGEKKYKVGVGAMATYKLINYVFDDLKLNKLISMVLSYNKDAINLNESFGFKQEALYKQHCFKDNKFIDMFGFSLLKKDWIKLKPYFKGKFSNEK